MPESVPAASRRRGLPTAPLPHTTTQLIFAALLSGGDLFLDLAPKFQRVANHLEWALGATCPAHHDAAVTKHSAQDTLIHADSFHLSQKRLERRTADKSSLDHDSLAGDAEL